MKIHLLDPNLNKTTKVLFISFWYPNKYKPNHALFVKRHAQALASVFNIEVLAVNIVQDTVFFKKEYIIEKDENGIKTHHLFLKSRFNKLLYVLLPIQYLIIKNLINKKIKPNFDFNWLHSNILFPCAIIGHWLSKNFACKHIITEHWSKIEKFFKVNLFKNAAKSALNQAHAITCVSSQLQLTLNKYHHNANCFIVPNVIDSSKFYPIANVEKPTVLTYTAVAHWRSPKQPFYFLDALEQLFKSNELPRFKVVLIGEGELLAQVVNRKYSFSIEYPGNLNPTELNQHFNNCHVFLHGSNYETFSVVIIEALMAGLPSIVSPVGVASEVINENNGFIAKNEVSDWKEKILLVIQKKYNPLLISDTVSNKYSLKVVANYFEKIYKNNNL